MSRCFINTFHAITLNEGLKTAVCLAASHLCNRLTDTKFYTVCPDTNTLMHINFNIVAAQTLTC